MLAVAILIAAWLLADPGSGTALSIARGARLVATGAVTGLLVLALVVWVPLRRAGTVDAPADGAFVAVGGRALRGFALLGTVGAAAALLLQAANGPAASVLDALAGRVGAWLAVTAVAFAALAVVGPAALRAGRVGGRPRALSVVLVLVAILNVTPALGGHAAASSSAVVLVPVEIVHVVGMGAWVGGLLGLLIVLPPATRALPEGPARTRLMAAVLLRFSPVALTAVVVLTLAGTALSLLSLTTLYDLADTAYGRAVFAKIVLLLIAIALAVLQREYLVPQLERAVAAGDPTADDAAGDPVAGDGAGARGLADGPPPEPAVAARHVRAALRGEALLLVAVLIVTGALAGYPTPKALADRPATVTRSADGLALRMVVEPARVGRNALRLTVRHADGRPAADVGVGRMRALPPGRAGSSDTPVDVTVVPAGPGRWRAVAVPLGARGRWKVTVELRTASRGRVTATLPVRVR